MQNLGSERLQNRRRTMNSFQEHPMRQHRLDSNGSTEPNRRPPRSRSLCECFPNRQRSQTGNEMHISWRCVHVVKSNAKFIKTKAGQVGNVPTRPIIEAYNLMTVNQCHFNQNYNNNLNQNQNNTEGIRRAGRGYLRRQNQGIGDAERRRPVPARRCPGMYDVRVSVLSATWSRTRARAI